MEFVRDKVYLIFVRGSRCLACGATGVHAHHLKMVEAVGQGRKVGDQWTVPLCAVCHDHLHHWGDEQTWWDIRGVDPVGWAKQKWKEYNDQN